MSRDSGTDDDATGGEATDDEAADGEGSSLPDCPRCGEPVVISVALGPHTGSVGPCGCSVPPQLFPELRKE